MGRGRPIAVVLKRGSARTNKVQDDTINSLLKSVAVKRPASGGWVEESVEDCLS